DFAPRKHTGSGCETARRHARTMAAVKTHRPSCAPPCGMTLNIGRDEARRRDGPGGHGRKADRLPGCRRYRRIDDPAVRARIAQMWGVSRDDLPRACESAYQLPGKPGTSGGAPALPVYESNSIVLVPNAVHVEKRLRNLDFSMVCDFVFSDTAGLADA